MKSKFTLRQRLRFSFENTLSKGTSALLMWLGIVVVLFLLMVSVITLLIGVSFGDHGRDFIEHFWQLLLRTLDNGVLSGDEEWVFRPISLMVTLFGILVASYLIGALSSGIQQSIEQLRKGKSLVLAENHTLILGWPTKLIPMVQELIIANENQKKPVIVILADRDKVEMEDEVNEMIPDKKNTRIICRSGSPLELNDLKIVSPNTAKAIIVLAPETDNPDIYVIKSVLALTNNPLRKKDKYHIVAEIHDNENLEAAHLVGGDETTYVESAELIARVTSQTCRQSGLSVIYTELFDMDGDEIYFKTETDLTGKTYKDSLFAYESSAVIGLATENKVLINPPMDTIIKAEDQIIAITKDDDTIVLSGKTKEQMNVDTSLIVERAKKEIKIEKYIVLGWNDKANTIIKELDSYVAPNSTVTIVAEPVEVTDEIAELNSLLQNLKINYVQGDTTTRKVLDNEKVQDFHNIIVLGYQHIPMQEADAKTLITLLHLRNIGEQYGKSFNIVSEMYDMRNRELAEVTKADDFIISDKMISLILAQLSENQKLKKVFDELFTSEGSEIYLKPAKDYVKIGVPMNFYSVLESAAQKGESAVGYRILANAHFLDLKYGVVVNPNKSAMITFDEKDKIIVLAEDLNK